MLKLLPALRNKLPANFGLCLGMRLTKLAWEAYALATSASVRGASLTCDEAGAPAGESGQGSQWCPREEEMEREQKLRYINIERERKKRQAWPQQETAFSQRPALYQLLPPSPDLSGCLPLLTANNCPALCKVCCCCESCEFHSELKCLDLGSTKVLPGQSGVAAAQRLRACGPLANLACTYLIFSALPSAMASPTEISNRFGTRFFTIAAHEQTYRIHLCSVHGHVLPSLWRMPQLQSQTRMVAAARGISASGTTPAMSSACQRDPRVPATQTIKEAQQTISAPQLERLSQDEAVRPLLRAQTRQVELLLRDSLH